MYVHCNLTLDTDFCCVERACLLPGREIKISAFNAFSSSNGNRTLQKVVSRGKVINKLSINVEIKLFLGCRSERRE